MSEYPSYNQINEQESSAYVSGGDMRADVLIKQPSGGVTVGRLDKATGNVHVTEDGQEELYPNVPLERLTDEHQGMLARELAGIALLGDTVYVPRDGGVVEGTLRQIGSDQGVSDGEYVVFKDPITGE